MYVNVKKIPNICADCLVIKENLYCYRKSYCSCLYAINSFIFPNRIKIEFSKNWVGKTSKSHLGCSQNSGISGYD